jgi:hypothetical protein
MDNVIAKVNGEELTREVVDRAVTRFIIQLEEDDTVSFEPNKENMKYVKTEVMNHLIERMLLLQKAKKDGLDVPLEAVSRNIEMMKSNFGTEDEWKANLTALRIPENTLFDEIKNDMIVEKYLGNHYLKDIQFSEEELKNYYNINERLMKEPDLFSFYEVYANNAAEVKTIHELINKHDDLAQITDELNKIKLELHNHTDVPAYQLPEEVYNVLSDVEVGKIASMQTPDQGMLVYKLTNKIMGKSLMYDDIKEKLAEYLIQNAKTDITNQLIKKEMDQAKIEYQNTTYLES